MFYANGLRSVEGLKLFAKRMIFPSNFPQHMKDYMVEIFILLTCFVNWKSSIRTFLFVLARMNFWKKVLLYKLMLYYKNGSFKKFIYKPFKFSFETQLYTLTSGWFSYFMMFNRCGAIKVVTDAAVIHLNVFRFFSFFVLLRMLL